MSNKMIEDSPSWYSYGKNQVCWPHHIREVSNGSQHTSSIFLFSSTSGFYPTPPLLKKVAERNYFFWKWSLLTAWDVTGHILYVDIRSKQPMVYEYCLFTVLIYTLCKNLLPVRFTWKLLRKSKKTVSTIKFEILLIEDGLGSLVGYFPLSWIFH